MSAANVREERPRAAAAGEIPLPGRPAAPEFPSAVVQVLGELLITAGVVLLLFIAWQLWWTNLAADAEQRAVIKRFRPN